MNEPTPETRYIGMDIHKRYAVIGGVNREQAFIYQPQKVSYDGWRRWIRKHLRATDEVVIEATGNCWHMVDELQPFVKRVVVAHARQVKLIAAARVKTDKVDALNLAQLDLFTQQQADIDAELARLSRTPTWEPQVRLLLQLPGFGVLTAMTVLGAIGDIERFATARKLVGYAGLGASARARGNKRYTGAITKAGRKDLRRALVHAAHMAVRSHPHWQQQYQAMCRRIPKQKAIVAIARKLLVVIWHVLVKGEIDQHSSVARIGYRMAIWYWRLPKAQKENFSRAQFVRWQLMQLDIGHDLTHNPLPHARAPSQRLRLATAAEAQACFG